MTTTTDRPDRSAEAASAAADTGAELPEALTPAAELRLLSQIASRVARLTTGGKIWLRDSLAAQIEDEL
jgi:hypothetical protein